MVDDFIEGAYGDPFDPASADRMEEQNASSTELEDNAVVQMIARRRRAYTAVFTEGNRSQEDIDYVLCDLMWFCRVTAPSFDAKDGIHADTLAKMKEGRREVFMRVRDFSRLDTDTLLAKYTDAITRSIK